MADEQRIDLEVGIPGTDDQPIDLGALRRSAPRKFSAGQESRSGRPRNPKPAVGGRGDTAIFDQLTECYKAAADIGSDEAWRKVKDFVMGNLGTLVDTRLVTFRDLMNLTLEIDQRLKGKTEDQGALRRFEESWVLPDVKP